MRKTSNHIFFWIAYTLYFFLSGLITTPEKFTQIHHIFQNVIISVLEIIACFYLLLYRIFPETLPTKKYQLLFFSLITLAVICSVGNAFVIYFYRAIIHEKFNFYRSCTVGLNNLYLSIHFALAYWFATNFIQNVREQSKAELQKNMLEKSILEAELSSLKNQINPHFLYNSLNFLYAQALPMSKKLSDSVMLLAEMMRYTVKENNNEGKVSLIKEIQYIKNYVAIQQIQFDGKLNVELEIIGNIHYRRIHPLTISPLIENTFKNGVLNDIQCPVSIWIETQANNLFLTITYKRKIGISEKYIFDDLMDVRRRLYIGYFNNHFIKFEHTDCNQKIFLKLSL